MRTVFISIMTFIACQSVYTFFKVLSEEISDEVEFDIVEVEYDGHSYLVFDGYGVVHNQSCVCYDND